MGRRPSTETSPIYGSFIVSLLYRSVTVFDPSQPPKADDAMVLDRILQSAFNVPEITQWASVGLEFLKAKSEAEWRKLARRGVRYVLRRVSKTVRELGRPDPFCGWSLDDRIGWLLDELRWDVSFEEAASLSKAMAIGIFERIANGKQEELTAWCKEIVGDLFGADPRQAIATIRFCLLAFGGASLVSKVDKAIRIVRDRLVSSLEFRAAVADAEYAQKWRPDRASDEFTAAWQQLSTKAVGRLRSKNLSISGAEEMSAGGKRTWSEETHVAMISVYEELRKRATMKPYLLIADTYNGKLSASLVLTVEHDIWDRIRSAKAQKRDVRKQDSLERDEDHRTTSMQPVADVNLARDIIEAEDWQDLMGLLTPDERAVAEGLRDGFTQELIARKLGRSQAWVSERVQRIRKKLELLLSRR